MNNFGKIATTSLATGALILTIGAAESHADSFKATSYETTANLNVRNAAGTNGTVVLKTLKKGTVVKVTEFNSTKTWAKIGNGQWVSAQYLKLANVTNNTNTAKPSYAKTTISMRELTVTATSLNVRTGPGTSYSVVGSLKKGATAMTNAQSGNWYEIGTNRWIHKDYVTETIWSMNSNATDKPLDTPASDDDFSSMNSTATDELLDVAPGDEDPTRYVNVSEGSALNVRYTRALGGSVKDKLPRNKAVTVLNTINGVSYIKYVNDKGQLVFGYVAAQYLEAR